MPGCQPIAGDDGGSTPKPPGAGHAKLTGWTLTFGKGPGADMARAVQGISGMGALEPGHAVGKGLNWEES